MIYYRKTFHIFVHKQQSQADIVKCTLIMKGVLAGCT